MKVRLLGCTLAMGLAGCAGSPEIHYYTLSAQADQAQAPGASRAVAGCYAIGAVTVPDLLDRPQIVLRNGSNTVGIRDNDRWASPLSDELRRVLAADLGNHIGAGAMVEPGLPPPPNCSVIHVSIMAFDPQQDGGGVIQASWTISKQGSGGTTKVFSAYHSIQSGKRDIADLVATMSTLLSALADNVAETIVNGETASAG